MELLSQNLPVGFREEVFIVQSTPIASFLFQNLRIQKATFALGTLTIVGRMENAFFVVLQKKNMSVVMNLKRTLMNLYILAKQRKYLI